VKGKLVTFECGHTRFFWFAALGVSDEEIEKMSRIGRVGYCRICWKPRKIVANRDLTPEENEELIKIKKMFDTLKKTAGV